MDEDLTGRTGDLVAGLAMFRDASVPAPGPELAALFAAQASTVAPAPSTPRRAPVYKRILAGIPGKVAAGALGALLAGTVGAGAMTGTISLTSSESDAPSVETPAVEEAPVVVADADEHEAEVEEEAAVDEVDDDGANDAAADGDLAAVPVPTSVDEAARTHDFDEACGNHGAYVSQFALTGTEPDCAVQARAGAAAAGDGTTPDATDVSASSADEPTHENHGNGKSASAAGAGADKADHAANGGKSTKGTKSKSGR